jgi:hypothetical protein
MKTTSALCASAAVLLLSLAPAGASAPSGRYVIGGQASFQTVFDTKTKLTWERATTGLVTAEAAKARCANLSATTGGAAWRLPTIKELYTLLDHSVPSPDGQIDSTAFPNQEPGRAWAVNGAQGFQCVNFFGSDLGCNHIAVPDLNTSRCVR